jgi:hypothetical protein
MRVLKEEPTFPPFKPAKLHGRIRSLRIPIGVVLEFLDSRFHSSSWVICIISRHVTFGTEVEFETPGSITGQELDKVLETPS